MSKFIDGIWEQDLYDDDDWGYEQDYYDDDGYEDNLFEELLYLIEEIEDYKYEQTSPF